MTNEHIQKQRKKSVGSYCVFVPMHCCFGVVETEESPGARRTRCNTENCQEGKFRFNLDGSYKNVVPDLCVGQIVVEVCA